MSSSHKVFIFQNDGTSQQSSDDLKTLLSREDIFPGKPDIQIGAYTFNPRGLTDFTLVVPGGSCVSMGHELAPQMKKFREIAGEKFNYLGICAGGFFGTATAEISPLSYEDNGMGGYKTPLVRFTFRDLACGENPLDADPYNLRMVTDYHSIGPFYPDYSFGHVSRELGRLAKPFMPYCLNINILAESPRKIPQLYVAGPMFVPVEEAKHSESTQVYAKYSKEIYSFFKRKNEILHYEAPAAIIGSRKTETRGARFLAATHIEACVSGSKLLQACNQTSEYNDKLKNASYQRLLENQEDAEKEMVSMLRRTFS